MERARQRDRDADRLRRSDSGDEVVQVRQLDRGRGQRLLAQEPADRTVVVAQRRQRSVGVGRVVVGMVVGNVMLDVGAGRMGMARALMGVSALFQRGCAWSWSWNMLLARDASRYATATSSRLGDFRQAEVMFSRHPTSKPRTNSKRPPYHWRASRSSLECINNWLDYDTDSITTPPPRPLARAELVIPPAQEKPPWRGRYRATRPV